METIGLLFKVFWAPAEAMFLVSKNPRILAPLLLLCAVSLASSLVVSSRIDMTDVMIRQAERRGQEITDDQRVQFQRMSSFMGPVVVVSAAIGTAVIITAAAAIYFGMFTLIGREAGFKAFYAVTAFAYLPLMIRSVVAVLQALFVPQSSLVMEELGSLSLAVFLDPTSVPKLLYSVALMADIVSVWTAVLLVIGFKFLVNRSVTKPVRIAGVAVVYLFFAGIGIFFRMLSGG